jgi:hypothetical protein
MKKGSNKKQEIHVELKTRIIMDNLKFGWACPLCGIIYSPYVCKCPNKHKGLSGETKVWELKKEKEKVLMSPAE